MEGVGWGDARRLRRLIIAVEDGLSPFIRMESDSRPPLPDLAGCDQLLIEGLDRRVVDSGAGMVAM